MCHKTTFPGALARASCSVGLDDMPTPGDHRCHGRSLCPCSTRKPRREAGGHDHGGVAGTSRPKRATAVLELIWARPAGENRPRMPLGKAGRISCWDGYWSQTPRSLPAPATILARVNTTPWKGGPKLGTGGHPRAHSSRVAITVPPELTQLRPQVTFMDT
jgi:hypothetical protein